MTLEHRDLKLIHQANVTFLVITSLAIFSLGLYYYLPRSSPTTVLGTSTTPTETPTATPSSTIAIPR